MFQAANNDPNPLLPKAKIRYPMSHYCKPLVLAKINIHRPLSMQQQHQQNVTKFTDDKTIRKVDPDEIT
jgi:hypothetical protein